MPSLGKSINLYLMDGTAAGRWQATLSNWNGIAYKIPRGMLKECFTDLTDLNAPGVYFLFGRDDSTWRQFIYIGEGDDVLKRLTQPHTFEKDGSYWTEAIIFITPDGTLEKGRIKYLENRFYTIAKEADRYLVKNGNTPPQSPMPKQIRDLLEEFIINAMLVAPALGYMAFEPLKPSESEKSDEGDGLLYFSRSHGKGGNAAGKLDSDGFWVLKGSFIYPKVADYAPKKKKKLREQHAASIDVDGILQEDVMFGSPSYAATFVCGKNSNGLAEWKDKNGIPLKDIDMSQQASPDSSDEKNSEAVSISAQISDGEVFHLAGKKVAATGRISGNGFTVCKGSGFCPAETKSCHKHIKTMRMRLIAEGKVKDGVFLDDVYFNSTSTAAACIIGGSANGNIMWINPDGKTIKELNQQEDK